ncbi:DedA family protein [Haloechinothrix salitolerans]|uniref:DedA family protein n=1 Tax=Haloechinothrix salitolerans TaxID=926830 RepID=A0ABW2BV85_9PSEU
MPTWLQAETLLSGLGPYMLLGLCLIVFAECGLLIGFFLPGDSLLFTAGLFVADGLIAEPLWLVCLVLVTCAFLGNVTGYWIGRKAGPALFNRSDSRLFKQAYAERTHDFFDKHGARAIVLARFVPIVRTFITAIAGAVQMSPRHYLTYSAVGGVIWAAGLTVLGYFLGRIDWVRNNLEPVLLMIVAISITPIVTEFLMTRRAKRTGAT